jgi:predicted lipoprotein with Yx(FWY)xxD motif
VLVDGQGKTVYVFDKDAMGATASACTDQCATTWPAVVATAATPTGDGVDADLASITGVSGEPQVTVDGLPVYTFAKDTAPGDVMGQGVMGKWWVLSPTGEKITAS